MFDIEHRTLNIRHRTLQALPLLCGAFIILEKIFMKWSVIFIETIALENKILLNIKEASDLFGIGQHRLREIVHEDFGNKYHLMLGRTIKIKRKQFEEFIEQVEQI